MSNSAIAVPGVTDEIADHPDDPTAAHAASAIAFTPTGTIVATDVQAAIAEVAAEAGGIVGSFLSIAKWT